MMKKSILFGILFIFIILLISCGKSPQEKLVGEWDQYKGGEWQGTWTFDSDGAFSWSNNLGSGKGVCNLEQTGSNTLVLHTLAGGVSNDYEVIFKTNDDLEIGSWILKRKTNK